MMRFVMLLMVLAVLAAMRILVPFLNVFWGVGDLIWVCCAVNLLGCVFFTYAR